MGHKYMNLQVSPPTPVSRVQGLGFRATPLRLPHLHRPQLVGPLCNMQCLIGSKV